MKCGKCGKVLMEGEKTYQIRIGYIENGEFVPEEDIGYLCGNCYIG
jgi:hypothetical protein